MQTGTPAHYVRPRTPKQRAIIAAIVLMLLLAGCDFGRPAATPEPFTPPTYEPGFATRESESQDADQPDAAEQDQAAEGEPVETSSGETNTTNAAPVQRTSDGGTVYTGEIEPDEEVPIMAEVGGQVLEVSVEVGDYVAKGDVLVRIDSTTLEAQRAQALAALEAAQANVDLLMVEADEADIEAARAAVAAADAAYQRALEGPS